MNDQIKELGKVKLVQVQPVGMIIETPGGYFYDVTRRVEVKSLIITALGIEADLANVEHVLDIHHINHPDKAYTDDLVSIKKKLVIELDGLPSVAALGASLIRC